MKLSQEFSKITIPARKQIYRLIGAKHPVIDLLIRGMQYFLACACWCGCGVGVGVGVGGWRCGCKCGCGIGVGVGVCELWVRVCESVVC